MLKSIILILFLALANFIFAQDLQYEINSASATIRKDCFLINWSLGIIENESFANEEIGFVNNWIYEETINDFQDNMSDELIYISPNPVVKMLNIKVDEQCELPFIANVYDLNGIRIVYKTIINNREMIDLSSLSQGLYIIEFTNSKVQLGRYKIIKY